MKISTKSRYGLKACEELAKDYGSGQPLPLCIISERTGVTDTYLEQIFILLKKANIVDSVRGVSGGYILSRSPDKISIGEVLRALEDGLEFVKCISTPCADAENEGGCRSRDVWTRIYNGINTILDGMSLQDMLDDNIKERK